MIVKIEDLRKICKNILDRVEDVTKEEIDLSFTTFWTTTFKDGQKLDPPTPIARDLRDYWNLLEKKDFLKDCPDGVYLEMLGEIVKSIGLKLDMQNNGKNEEKTFKEKKSYVR